MLPLSSSSDVEPCDEVAERNGRAYRRAERLPRVRNTEPLSMLEPPGKLEFARGFLQRAAIAYFSFFIFAFAASHSFWVSSTNP